MKADPTAAARSSIRRRASVHGSRNRRLTRDPTFVPPRFERSPPPGPRTASTVSRYSRRNGVPPIQSLLEHADRSLPLPPPPPPVPHSRHYYTLERRERELRDSLDQLHAQAANLRRSAQDFIRGASEEHDNDLWTEAERRTLLETASVAHSRRPGLQIHRSRGASRTADLEYVDAGSSRDATRHLPRPSLLDNAESESSVGVLPRTLLPTPPLDQSEPDGDSLFMPDNGSNPTRPMHPLSHAWQVSSPTLNGLGDRDRSPTPDTWAIMETTIPPDTTFVSAESSFATNPATNSFASSNDTTITEPERESASGRRSTEERRREENNDNSDGDSDSSIDIDCTDEEYIAQAESFAREMYYHEMATPEGRARIFSNIPDADHLITPVDVGFQLIDNALNTEEGRERVANLGGDDAIHRMVRFRDPAQRQTRTQTRSSPYRPHSPPATSQEPPSANPVSSPSRRSTREVSDILINLEDGNDQQDLETMRRVARRLATREDVPDDWWASMGLRLNPSLAQPRQHRRRARSPDGVRRADMHVERAIGRVRGGRIERGDARL